MRGAFISTVAAAVAALLVPAAASAAPGEAVVMVSGYSTSTAFTTSDPACDGQEGITWGNPNSPAAALKAAGHDVFTAPAKPGADGPILLPCTGPGDPTPGEDMEIDSFGDVDANGRALARFLGFLRDEYAIDTVALVAHSDGGIWSRSAITQNAAYSGVTIRSLNTLGTPYSGAFTADAAVAIRKTSCKKQPNVIRQACDVLQVLIDAELFSHPNIAANQLTNDYMGTWNPRQTIGSCPVTPIAGDWLKLPLLFEYYTPSDALVGIASALAESSFDIFAGHPIPAPEIPNLQKGTTYPVVHSPTLAFLTPKNLLNQPAISNQIVDSVGFVPLDPKPCNVAADPGAKVDKASQRVPLHELSSPDRKRRLDKPEPGDMLLLKRNVSVRCGRGGEIPAGALLDSDRLRLAHTSHCDNKLRVNSTKGKRAARRGAMELSESPAGDAVLKVAGDGEVSVRARGRKLQNVRVRFRVPGEAWERLKLRKGRGSIPAAEEDLDVRITARTPGAGKASGFAALSR